MLNWIWAISSKMPLFSTVITLSPAAAAAAAAASIAAVTAIAAPAAAIIGGSAAIAVALPSQVPDPPAVVALDSSVASAAATAAVPAPTPVVTAAAAATAAAAGGIVAPGEDGYVDGLAPAVVAAVDGELHPLALPQRAEALGADLRLVNEEIVAVAAAVRRDEAEAFLAAEPLHRPHRSRRLLRHYQKIINPRWLS